MSITRSLLLSAALIASGQVALAQSDDHLTCTTHGMQHLQAFLAGHPERLAEISQAEHDLEAFTQNFSPESDNVRGGTQYVIPVVFHIIHNNGPENISDEQCEDAIRVLNEDFNKLNSDWDNVNPAFLGIVADIGITFRIAQKDPNGNCTKGITRTVSPLTNDGTQDMKDLIQWPRNKYLNVWVAASANGAAGYTQTPGSVSSAWAAPADGIVLLHTYVGAIGTSSFSHSRTLTHEVGHWINLSHCWGPTNDPGLPENCDVDDNVTDTPLTIGWTNCNVNGASCGSPLDNVENYMEYSYCSKMFTEGQKARLIAALNSSTAQRNQLWQTSNLIATGTTGTDFLCAADFSSDVQVVCAGQPITFTDQSYNGVTEWNWSFVGASPNNSGDAQPVVTYTSPGVYAVSLTAGNGQNDVSTTKNAFITVLPNAGFTPPYSEDFENVANVPDAEWMIWNPDNAEGFELSSAAAYSGTKSLRLRNSISEDSDVDELLSSTVDLTWASSVSLSFRYAYARKNASSTDLMRVYVSNDCGASWSLRKQFQASGALSTAPNTTSQFTPTTSQWALAEITNITSAYHVSDFRFKIWFENHGGNNLWIDDINITVGNVGVQDALASSASGMVVVPNPAMEAAQLWMDLKASGPTRVELVDVTGRLIQVVQDGSLAAGTHRIDLPVASLESGLYFVRMFQNGIEQVVRFSMK